VGVGQEESYMVFTKGHPFYGDLSKPNYFQKGHKPSEKWYESRKNVVVPKEKDSWHWKGENGSYWAKHKWIVKNYGNPEYCEDCGKIGMKEGRKWNIDWSNCDHKYRRVREDYIGRCKSCHAIYDVLNNLRKNHASSF
jgi:hypothetical protein